MSSLTDLAAELIHLTSLIEKNSPLPPESKEKITQLLAQHLESEATDLDPSKNPNLIALLALTKAMDFKKLVEHINKSSASLGIFLGEDLFITIIHLFQQKIQAEQKTYSEFPARGPQDNLLQIRNNNDKLLSFCTTYPDTVYLFLEAAARNYLTQRVFDALLSGLEALFDELLAIAGSASLVSTFARANIKVIIFIAEYCVSESNFFEFISSENLFEITPPVYAICYTQSQHPSSTILGDFFAQAVKGKLSVLRLLPEELWTEDNIQDVARHPFRESIEIRLQDHLNQNQDQEIDQSFLTNLLAIDWEKIKKQLDADADHYLQQTHPLLENTADWEAFTQTLARLQKMNQREIFKCFGSFQENRESKYYYAEPYGLSRYTPTSTLQKNIATSLLYKNYMKQVLLSNHRLGLFSATPEGDRLTFDNCEIFALAPGLAPRLFRRG